MTHSHTYFAISKRSNACMYCEILPINIKPDMIMRFYLTKYHLSTDAFQMYRLAGFCHYLMYHVSHCPF